MARAATTTDVFNAIAEAKRREMIGLLNNGKYWTVSEIVGRMKITQPTASKHLRVLRKVGIVAVVKHGRYRQYRLNAQSLRPYLIGRKYPKVNGIVLWTAIANVLRERKQEQGLLPFLL